MGLLATKDTSSTHRMAERGVQHAQAAEPKLTAHRTPMHLTMTLEELLLTKDTSSTHRMVERGVQHAQAAEPKRTAHRRPMHLTMTLEELLAKNDTSSTHRMVGTDLEDMPTDKMLEMQREGPDMIFGMMQQSEVESEAACTAQRQEVNALFDMIREADVKAADALANPSIAERIDFGWRGDDDPVAEESLGR